MESELVQPVIGSAATKTKRLDVSVGLANGFKQFVPDVAQVK